MLFLVQTHLWSLTISLLLMLFFQCLVFCLLLCGLISYLFFFFNPFMCSFRGGGITFMILLRFNLSSFYVFSYNVYRFHHFIFCTFAYFGLIPISSFFSTHLCALLGGVALLLWYYYVLTLALSMFFPITYTVSIILYFVHSPILDWYLSLLFFQPIYVLF